MISKAILVFVGLTFALAQGNPEKINITVYYEVLCYHSVKLIQAQLYPTWNVLKDYIDIDFVPFGKAGFDKNETTGKWDLQCHHGPEECYGNKIQACALNEFKSDTALAMEYVRCSVNFNIDYPFKTTCFEDVSSDAESKKRFENCIVSDKGDELLVEYGKRTPSLTYIPTMTFNGVYDYDFDSKARRNLKRAVCGLIKSAKPLTC